MGLLYVLHNQRLLHCSTAFAGTRRFEGDKVVLAAVVLPVVTKVQHIDGVLRMQAARSTETVEVRLRV
jgi:hypothetical protein